MTYDAPLRLRIAKALSQRLAAISPAGGFHHDLTDMERVFRGRALFGEGDPVPAVSLLEAPQADTSPGPTNSTKAIGETEFLIQGWVEDDALHPTDPAHHLAADVRRALVLERKRASRILVDDADTFGLLRQGTSCVSDIRIGQPVVRPPELEVSSKAWFWLRVTVVFAEDLENPYA